MARRIEYLISDASFTSSFSAPPGCKILAEMVAGEGHHRFCRDARRPRADCRVWLLGKACSASWQMTRSRRHCTRSSLARDRPSILYYLLVAPAHEHAECVQLLRDVVHTCRTVELSAVDRALAVPREVHGTKTPRKPLSRASGSGTRGGRSLWKLSWARAAGKPHNDS